MKKLKLILAVFCCVGLLSVASTLPSGQSIAVDQTLVYFKEHAVLFAATTDHLEHTISKINTNDPQTITKAKEALIRARLSYKQIEFFLNYFFSTIALTYNAPAAIEVEEPFLEYREPTGFQVIEAMLFEKDPAAQKKEMLDQANLINSSARDLNSLLFNLRVTDSKILESVRIELINTSLLGIAGFDAPELKTGIIEAKQTLTTIQTILSPFLSLKNNTTDSVTHYLEKAIALVEKNKDFDSFNRLEFLTQAALPLQYHLGLLIKEKGLEINTTGVLNYNARNIFSRDAIDINPGLKDNAEIIDLGKKLFFEKALSGNYKQNCASCHHPEKYFTDQLPKSISIDGKSTVARNAPGLFYSELQYTQFWDGRADSLEEQIKTVLQNPHEMNADLKTVVQRLKNNKDYITSFKKAFSGNSDSSINIRNLTFSIAAFLKTLSPFNSPFDQYIQGNHQALTEKQIRGFNLFMGKAQCGTCHFAPVFNGTLPPLFNKTDVEVLGTTKHTNFDKPVLDADSGRFSKYPIPYYMRAFKTPTVRNVEKTFPYMHHGEFSTLENVLEFYNKGGGVGLGLEVPVQTLSPKPLNLDSTEVADIIAFMHSLSDSMYIKN
jgi:cytochrome c peroxidase